jgi:hypothetical protein
MNSYQLSMKPRNAWCPLNVSFLSKVKGSHSPSFYTNISGTWMGFYHVNSTSVYHIVYHFNFCLHSTTYTFRAQRRTFLNDIHNKKFGHPPNYWALWMISWNKTIPNYIVLLWNYKILELRNLNKLQVVVTLDVMPHTMIPCYVPNKKYKQTVNNQSAFM